MTNEEMNNAVQEAVELYRANRNYWNVAMACQPVAEDYGMNDAEFERFYNEVEFWVGKKKA